MSCERCSDIHQGQILGSNTKPCECDCHDSNTWTTTDTTGDFLLNTNFSCTTDGCSTNINLN